MIDRSYEKTQNRLYLKTVRGQINRARVIGALLILAVMCAAALDGLLRRGQSSGFTSDSSVTLTLPAELVRAALVEAANERR